MQVRKPTRLIAVSVVAAIAVSGSAAVASSIVTSASIKDGTIQVKDLSKKAQKKLKGKKGAQGAAGPAGTAGAKGAAGPPGPVVLKYVTGTPVTPTTGAQNAAVANCPEGYHVVGGGITASGAYALQNVNSSFAIDTSADTDAIPDNGWIGFVDDFGSGATITANAVCSLANAVAKTGPTVSAKK